MSSENESNTNFDNKVVHTSARGRRYYHVDNDEKKRLLYCCTGKDYTCTNQAKKGGLCVACGATRQRCKGFTKDERPCPNQAKNGGLCNGCGAPRPLCQGVIEGGGRCPNFVQRGGFCRTHDPKPPVCQGVNDDGSLCTKRARSRGLCGTHKDGSRNVMCPCGRVRQVCRKCNPLGNLVARIRATLKWATKRFIQGKSLGRAPKYFGCSWKYFFEKVVKDKLEKIGLPFSEHGQGPGKWNFDHTLAFFDKKNPSKTEDEIYRRAHYKNVEPMLSDDNQSKGNR